MACVCRAEMSKSTVFRAHLTDLAVTTIFLNVKYIFHIFESYILDVVSVVYIHILHQ